MPPFETMHSPQNTTGGQTRLSDTDLREKLFLRSGSLLLIGFLLTFVSDMRGSAGIFAWFMPIPFLLHSVLYRGFKNRISLLLVLVAASILMLAKTMSDPLLMSAGFSVMGGTVTGLRFFIAYLLWGYIRKRLGNAVGTAAFPIIVISLEYLQSSYTPLGDWGALANTQISNLPLLQSAALFGFLGISALMAWAAALAASGILRGSISGLKTQMTAFAVIFIALNVYGDLRLDYVPAGQYVHVAAIGTDYTFTGTLPDPNDPAVLNMTNRLIDSTLAAARQGASLVAWAEASTIVTPEGEKQLLARLTGLAKANHIAIVAAHAVLLPKGSPYHLENKFTWITDTGEIAETYRKHHPVPGEGSLPGETPFKLVPTAFGKMAGAICYDFDFPKLALSYARLGAELVVLPGLDWRGMLRRHSLMARLRAIEGGFPILRPADGATSMAFDSRGKILASLPNFGSNDRIMMAYMPVGRTKTLYSRTGNIIAYAGLLTLVALLFAAGRNHLREQKTET